MFLAHLVLQLCLLLSSILYPTWIFLILLGPNISGLFPFQNPYIAKSLSLSGPLIFKPFLCSGVLVKLLYLVLLSPIMVLLGHFESFVQQIFIMGIYLYFLSTISLTASVI